MKYVTMELGGKSPCVILPDASVEDAVNGAMMANFFSTGQVCTNGTRVFVPESMKSEFEKVLLQYMDNIRAGDLFDPNTNFGPLVSETHYKKVNQYIKHGIESDKAKLIYGGLGKPDNASPNGFWVKPTVFTDCPWALFMDIANARRTGNCRRLRLKSSCASDGVSEMRGIRAILP